MRATGPGSKIIGGAGVIATAVWGISEGRMPTLNQMIGDITATETPRIFWGYIISLLTIGAAGLIWGVITSFRR